MLLPHVLPAVAKSALLRSAYAVGAVNTAGFAVTAASGSHKLTDLCGTGGFVVSAVASLHAASQAAPLGPRALLLGGAIAVWGARLGGYLFKRVLETGEDERLVPYFRAEGEGLLDLAKSAFPLKLAFFWSLQSAWGYLVSLPGTLAIATGAAPALGPFGIACAAGLVGGFALEAVADAQKCVKRIRCYCCCATTPACCYCCCCPYYHYY